MANDADETLEKSPAPGPGAGGQEATLAAIKRIGEELEQIMDQVAKREGAPSFWDWLEAQTGQPFSEEAQAFTVGTLVGWLIAHGAKPSRNPQAKVRAEKLKELAAYCAHLAELADTLANELETSTRADDTYFIASGVDNLPWIPERGSVHLAPRLRAYAEGKFACAKAAPRHRSQRSDEELIVGLAEIFTRVGGKVTSTPNGPFARMVECVWHILPPDQRCTTEGALVQYIKSVLPQIRNRHNSSVK